MSVTMRCVRETLTRGCMLQSYMPISQGTVKYAQPQPLVQQCGYQERKNVCSSVQIYLSVSRRGEARNHCRKLSPWTQGGHATIVASSLYLDALQVIFTPADSLLRSRCWRLVWQVFPDHNKLVTMCWLGLVNLQIGQAGGSVLIRDVVIICESSQDQMVIHEVAHGMSGIIVTCFGA
jgi:hypothetical protein